MIIRFEICQTGFYATSFWTRALRNEWIVAKRDNESFAEWLWNQYKCKMLTNSAGGYIGVDIEDSGLTLLLLKYPTYDVQV